MHPQIGASTTFLSLYRRFALKVVMHPQIGATTTYVLQIYSISRK